MATVSRARPPARPQSRLAAPEVYRINVDQYERMADVLEDERIELIDGYLVTKMPQKHPHSWTVEVAHAHVERLLPRGWFIREEKPVRIPRFDEPEPDLSLIRGRRDDFLGRHAGPKDIALLVEVSDTTLDRDYGDKKAAYARARIPVYWIINLIDRQVEVFSDPSRGRYRSSQIYQPGENVPVVIADAVVGHIAVKDILAPRR
jgi:Uma2 family endonuclease